MKSVLVAIGLLSSGLALAQSAPQPQGGRPVPLEVRQGIREEAHAYNKRTFEEHKAEILKRQDERAQVLKKETDCISKASNPEALRDCHETAHELRRVLHEHFMEHMHEMHADGPRHDHGGPDGKNLRP